MDKEDYRITKVKGGWQPEMRFRCRNDVLWVPLNSKGYWANPDNYSDPSLREQSDITERSVMSKEDAKATMQRAILLNTDAPIIAALADPRHD